MPTPHDERTLADSDQTFADSDQTLADGDQTTADSDQTSADSDQLASDRDQAASDRDLAHGVDPRVHAFSRDVRKRTARQRDQTAHARLVAADKRDEIAHARDMVALARDQAADARNLAIAQLEAAYEQDDGGRPLTATAVVMPTEAQRKLAAQYRAQAAEHRALASQDRQAAAEDRGEAARERLRSLVDREALVHQLAIAETDPLTGARTRTAGLKDLDHEFERCRRTDTTFVVAYVDAIGLNAVDDGDGHAANDELIKRIMQLIKAHVRPYDLIIRIDSDHEFLCAMSDMTLPDARQRFSVIADAPYNCAIRTGFAELTPEDSVTSLLARADDELTRL